MKNFWKATLIRAVRTAEARQEDLHSGIADAAEMVFFGGGMGELSGQGVPQPGRKFRIGGAPHRRGTPYACPLAGHGGEKQ